MIVESDYDLNRSLFGADSQAGELSWVLVGHAGKIVSADKAVIDFDPLDLYAASLLTALIGDPQGARSLAVGYFVRSAVDVLITQGERAHLVLRQLKVEYDLPLLGFFVSDRLLWATTASGSLLELEDLNRHGRLAARAMPWRP